jgi:hypothetical protein
MGRTFSMHENWIQKVNRTPWGRRSSGDLGIDENNTKTDFWELRCEGLDWTGFCECMDDLSDSWMSRFLDQMTMYYITDDFYFLFRYINIMVFINNSASLCIKVKLQIKSCTYPTGKMPGAVLLQQALYWLILYWSHVLGFSTVIISISLWEIPLISIFGITLLRICE